MGLILATVVFLVALGFFVTVGCWLTLKLLVWTLFLPFRILFKIVLAPLWLAGVFLKLVLAVLLLPLAVIGLFIALLAGLTAFFIPLAFVLLLVGVVWLLGRAAGATTGLVLR